MGFNLSQIGISYSLLTIYATALIALICAFAVFVCIGKASALRKILCYFIMTPIYFVLASAVFARVGSLTGVAAPAVAVCGFCGTVTVGIIYLSLQSLICGAGILRRGGAVMNFAATVVCFGANAYVTYLAWNAARLGGSTVSISECLPQAAFLPAAIAESGVELVCLAIFVVYAVFFFSAFVSSKSVDEIRESDVSRSAKQADKGFDRNRCCALCEQARPLSDDDKMLCDKCGVVDASYVCRAFIYDPLKYVPAKPRLPHSLAGDETPHGDEYAHRPSSEGSAECDAKIADTESAKNDET